MPRRSVPVSSGAGETGGVSLASVVLAFDYLDDAEHLQEPGTPGLGREQREICPALAASSAARVTRAFPSRTLEKPLPARCAGVAECSFVLKEADLPLLLTADEVASLLRTSRKVIYGMIGLGQIPGVTRIGRRVLVRRDRLLQFLRERESSVSSPGGAA